MNKLPTFFLAICLFFNGIAQNKISYSIQGKSYLFTNGQGEKLRLTLYGNKIIRVQKIKIVEAFFADDRYEMVASHNWSGQLTIKEESNFYMVSANEKEGITVKIEKSSMKLSFIENSKNQIFLKDKEGVFGKGDSLFSSFESDSKEHFTGLGHGYFGREESLDLKNKIVSRNYGTEHGQQAPLIVPFYLSSKGYGVFLNSTFPNQFNFGANNQYQFSIKGGGQMDYFVLYGPTFSQLLDLYTQLTGRPRLPLKSFFGLALSDKGNDHTTSDPSDENWWKKKIGEHRKAGFPLDHVVNDNRWRAGGGQRCLSFYEWDTVRYKDPKEYANWLKTNGLITTLDFNRCIAVQSEGWKPSFNLPQNDGIDFNTSAPDFTKKEVRDWFWNIMWRKSLDPKLGYPGNALWIDEFDEMGKAPLTMKFEDGTTWQEMRNYWFFLIAKSLVQEGWDKSFNGSKRPFVWVRGMTAGAQRYATLWSGDIKLTYEDMRTQVRALQLAGLSGFPFWSHDAGGFYEWELKKGPSDAMYRQWSLAFGSFTPFWKPHGVGESRWPLDRPIEVQQDFKKYSELHYKLVPYSYSYAHLANTTGTPIARAMVLEYQNDSTAWTKDLQYLWGKELLIAPNCSENKTVDVWLPQGDWFDFWNDAILKGGKTISYDAPLGKLPLFVKAGAIIPMAKYAKSTAFINSDSLDVHVYVGKDGQFELYEDDGNSEAYQKNEQRTTLLKFENSTKRLVIEGSKGQYVNANSNRAYEIVFHGVESIQNVEFNTEKLKLVPNAWTKSNTTFEAYWDTKNKTVKVKTMLSPVEKLLEVKLGE